MARWDIGKSLVAVIKRKPTLELMWWLWKKKAELNEKIILLRMIIQVVQKRERKITDTVQASSLGD